MSQTAPESSAKEPERRRHPRRGVRDMQLAPPEMGEIVDISGGGIRILTWEALPAGQELYLSFGPAGQRARVRTRVIWSRRRATEQGVDWTPGYQAGVQFLTSPS